MNYFNYQQPIQTYPSEAYGKVAVIELPEVIEWCDPWYSLGMGDRKLEPAKVAIKGGAEFDYLVSITKANLESLKHDSIAHLLQNGSVLLATAKVIAKSHYTRLYTPTQQIVEARKLGLPEIPRFYLARLFMVENLVLLPGLPDATRAIRLAKEELTFSF